MAYTLDQLRVRDGDPVTATGQVVAVPGRPVRFCAPVPVTVPDRPGPPEGSFGVDLVGADLDRLADPRSYEDTRWGSATITGGYADGTVRVTVQGAPVRPPRRASSLPDGTPCPAPDGGWSPGPVEQAGIEALQTLIAAHPERYGELVMTYPDGPAENATEVLMVTTTLPPETAERELREHFAGNLCVRPAARSRAEVDAVWHRIDPGAGADWSARRAYQGGPDYLAGRVWIGLLVLDEGAYRWLADADGGTGIVEADPWLRPAR